MDKEGKTMKYRNILKKRILAGLLAGAAACAAAPALAASGVVPNTQLPQGGNFVAGGGTIGAPSNGQMTITQNTQNGVIKWDGGFNIGANATVNFEGPQNGYNTLNYDASGNMSQIYGAINANNNGNIYIVNPAGVEISNSAQINVGSLYVSNKYLDNALKDINTENPDIPTIIKAGITQDTILMSLGNINADKVTFDGDRIVIDTERLKDAGGDAKLIDVKNGLTIRTTNADNVVIGYDAYDEVNGYTNAKTKKFTITEIKTGESGHIAENAKEVDGYMWVEDVEQLQAIKDNLDGNYALRNSIDATATQDWADNSGTGKGFVSIGSDGEGNSFTGKFDGLDYNIFNLNIDRDTDNVGLFGVVGDKAVINNVTLVGGSITGDNYVGALAGLVQGDASISNITNSAKVSGTTSVGGVIGQSDGGKYTNLVNTGTVTGNQNNIGGLIGKMENSTLGGTSYNLGAVTAKDAYNVGGLVGHAVNSVIGNEDTKDEEGQTVQGTTVYNRLNVTGAFSVGGIVGHMEGTTVQNAENSGTIAATGYDSNGKYSYHTAHYTGSDVVNGVKTENVNIANAGGIAGSASNVDGQESKIENAVNTGDVSSAVKSENGYDYYEAGNVGGIVGSAVDTNITNATNRENEIRGAHNVGGVAGYFSGSSTVNGGINDGGDILATGGRYNGDFVEEWVRAGTTGGEEAIVGNMGGIVGYMEGDEAYITASANRGTVHSQDITGTTVQPMSQAANAGGIVGKIDRSSTKDADTVKGDYTSAAVSNSYNTGDVRGYMGVGGVAGMMYNGEIAGSYNLGTIQTTRNAQSFVPGEYYSVNMGGIVGDTTENAKASALLYDVYNKGQIGDENFEYYARHVGGIVGRLSGTVEKAYNTGAIYNGYNVVGGIAGWFYTGSISNSFNTGNITVVNKEGLAGESKVATSQVGGIVGAAQAANHIVINGVYNLGTLRVFRPEGATGATSLGGIIGAIRGERGSIDITNAYTTGNLYAAAYDDDTNDYKLQVYSLHLGSIYGHKENSNTEITLTNTYYIKPEQTENGQFAQYVNGTDINYLFPVIGGNMKIDGRVYKIGIDNSNKAIDFDKKGDINQYKFDGGITNPQANGDMGANVDESSAWRIYEGSTPILNAFLPNTEGYFSENGLQDSVGNTGFDVQYGTAYDPLLTIINAAKGTNELTFNWQELGANNAAGIAVYGAGLKLTDFKATGGSGYYAGLLYADGALSISADGDAAFSSAAELYGSSVTIDAKGDVTIYGDVTATGNTKDGTTVKEDGSYEKLKNFTTDGRISITGGNVDIYGQLTSGAVGETVKGIGSIAEGWTPGDVSDPKAAMSDIGDRFGYTTSGSAVDGDITITANDASDGHVNVYYGNQEEGFIDAAGSLSVTAAGDIYMDSDLKVGGDLTLTSPGEMVLDLTNIGQVQADKGLVTDALTGLHDFMHQFETGGNTISFQTGTSDGTAADAKLAVDMWNDEKNAHDLGKYDTNDHTFKDELDQLNFTVQGDETASAAKYTYIWVSTGEQLAGIQQAADTNPDFLGYNFALKNDIDASQVQGYEAIGGGGEYKGTFDGRDNRIIGLDVSGDNAGIFSTVGAGGTVKDLRVYSGTFRGTDNAGAVAGVNNGTISNVTAFGNVVSAMGSSNSTELKKDDGSTVNVGAAGGIAGVNTGTIDNVTVSGTATAADGEEGNTALSAAGGIVGINMGDTAKISNSSSNSAVNASAESTYALGGAAGVNEGKLDNVDSLGVTTGIYQVGEHNPDVGTQYSDNVGGILGKNSGTNVSNVANASNVTGEAGNGETSDFVGGLVGDNEGNIDNGRNNGEITDNNYVGGLVGKNGTMESTLTNLTNDSAAAITGDKWVGGIAGANAGTISANAQELINRGTITGVQYVGGVAGENTGTITNTNNDVDLHVKEGAIDAKYFGGVAGINGHYDEAAQTVTKGGTITSATNAANVIAAGADYVGGIVGWNPEDGTLEGMGNSNKGRVEGSNYVGGVAGRNDAVIDGSKTDEGTVGIFNSGVVIAHDGGAGGLFGENYGDIANAELSNSGTVIGVTETEGNITGTGGIAGIHRGSLINVEQTNTGNVINTGGINVGGIYGYIAQDENGNNISITGSTLVNEGTVIGKENVGGVIGTGYADISKSDMYSTTDAQVVGLTNVGGLVGRNYGSIEGGREDANGKDSGFYTNQIYNNGTVTGGTWTDENNDNVVDASEIKVADGNVASSAIGGLIGNNAQENGKTGSLTAGYNTGAIQAKNGDNVGGIAGTNEGTLDQVFNTVITADGQNQTITGGTNVGGIVGSNTADGKISNAYNTTGVEGSNTTGSLVGTNGGNVANVYGSGADELIGTTTDNGSISNIYDSKNGFGTDGSKIDTEGGESAKDYPWRQYGENNPILKVFLTTVTYDPAKNDQNLVYNGKNEKLDIDKLIDTGAFNAGDEFIAHKNVDGGLIYHDEDNDVDAGKYTDDLWSEQIKAGGKDGVFDPNNLGYDVKSIEYERDKATINVSLGEIYRQYGNGDMYKDAARTEPSNMYGDYYQISVGNDADFAEGVWEKALGQIGVTVKDDGKGTGNKATANAGDHDWSIQLDISAIAKNYQFGEADSDATKTFTGSNQSHVAKAKLNVELGDVERTYGNSTITEGGYVVSGIIGLVNGDDALGYDSDDFTVMVTGDSALTGNTTGKVTQDVGDYTWTGTVTGKDGDLTNLSTNYDIEVNGMGSSTIKKATINIGADNKNIYVGDHEPTYTGTDIQGQLVNGDMISDDAYQYGPETSVDTSVTGEHTIGIHFGDSHLNTSEQSAWDAVMNGLFQNYTVTFTPGKLTISDMPVDRPSEGEHWNFLFDDNPWDRNRDFRERKAEVHFVAGGMTL